MGPDADASRSAFAASAGVVVVTEWLHAGDDVWMR